MVSVFVHVGLTRGANIYVTTLLPMSPFVFALHCFAITCIEAPLVEIGGRQSVSVQFTSFKKGIHEHALVYDPSVPTHSFTSRGEACQRLFGPVALESD
jgi:hypothetical protein